MVIESKEEVLYWFNQLPGARRIEVLSALLHSCVPLEIRFLATTIESIARRDYSFFYEDELRANNTADMRVLCSADWLSGITPLFLAHPSLIIPHHHPPQPSTSLNHQQQPSTTTLPPQQAQLHSSQLTQQMTSVTSASATVVLLPNNNQQQANVAIPPTTTSVAVINNSNNNNNNNPINANVNANNNNNNSSTSSNINSNNTTTDVSNFVNTNTTTGSNINDNVNTQTTNYPTCGANVANVKGSSDQECPGNPSSLSKCNSNTSSVSDLTTGQSTPTIVNCSHVTEGTNTSTVQSAPITHIHDNLGHFTIKPAWNNPLHLITPVAPLDGASVVRISYPVIPVTPQQPPPPPPPSTPQGPATGPGAAPISMHPLGTASAIHKVHTQFGHLHGISPVTVSPVSPPVPIPAPASVVAPKSNAAESPFILTDVRYKLVVSLCLLYSTNRPCATLVFNAFQKQLSVKNIREKLEQACQMSLSSSTECLAQTHLINSSPSPASTSSHGESTCSSVCSCGLSNCNCNDATKLTSGMVKLSIVEPSSTNINTSSSSSKVNTSSVTSSNIIGSSSISPCSNSPSNSTSSSPPSVASIPATMLGTLSTPANTTLMVPSFYLNQEFVSQVTLLFSLAICHPAFSFQQQSILMVQMREVTDYLDSFLPPFARLSQPPSAHSHHHHHHHHHIHHLATADANSASANATSTGVNSNVQSSNAPVQYLYHAHLTGPSHQNSSSNSVSPANSAGHHHHHPHHNQQQQPQQQVSSHAHNSSIQSVVNSNVPGSNSPSNASTPGAMGAPVDAVTNAASVSTSSSQQPLGLLSAPSGGPPCNSAQYTNSYFAIVDVFQEQSKPLGTVYCYNCGQPGHLGNVCSEKTLDDLTKSTSFNLKLEPEAPTVNPGPDVIIARNGPHH